MGRPCILIIDNDDDRRQGIAGIMRAEGYAAVATGSAAVGISFLGGNDVDLAFISLGLPDPPALDLLKRVKADYPATEAIVLAGGGMGDSAVEATNHGAFFYLVEPYENDQLLLLARHAIDKRQLQQKLRATQGECERFKEQLEYQSNFDGLTGLPNRNLLVDRLNQAILFARRNRKKAAVMLVGLDHFRLVNDTLGIDVGDQLLKIVAERLGNSMRATDTVAHYGGDEFAVVVSELGEEEDTASVAFRILSDVSRSLTISGQELVVSCSIGVSVYPGNGDDAGTLLMNADVALSRAKEEGRGNFQYYSGEMNEWAIERLAMERHLRAALEKDEFLLHFQPEVNLGTGCVTGMEALLRWQSPELGLVSPDRFIPLAEDTGLIVPIGEWVVRTACKQNRIWQDAGFPPVIMAVNLSPRQFRQKDLAEMVARVLRETGLEPRYLELEVTESLVMHDVDIATSVLEKLKNLGVRLAMDDFGTGHSSLSCLKRFPFDKLKIDMSFVQDIANAPGSDAIIRAIIAMAHSLNMRVIAEGVETEKQLGYLRVHQCDEMQGFFFSRPLPPHDFERLLREGRRLQFPGRTLLLVDDEPYILAALERVFESEGYQVITATSAAEGFERMGVNPVEVVVCDQRMPEMSGTEFLSLIKELYPNTVRIVLTGYADLETVVNAVNLGAIYKFHEKPWSDDALRESIREAFMHHELAMAAGEISN